MRGMQLVRLGSLAKSNVVSTVVKNASCSRGWLRLVVQSIFATVTVASFILIVIMAIPKGPKTQERPSRCRTTNCRVVCRAAPFFGEHENDVIHAVSAAEETCQFIFLTLDNAMFINKTMPPHWLSRLRTNIHELTIMNGNLMHVPPDAFLSQYTATIRVLSLHNLVLRTWTSESLVGLFNLRRLYVKSCFIVNMPRDALRAVDDTLQSLTITKSEHWDPANITGFTVFLKLTTVDFSFNSFKDILGHSSFTGLHRCKVMYLNSCKITSIGAGAFDNLHSLEMLYLHNNHLVTIPDGLFKHFIPTAGPGPRINLQDNLWHCDCSAKEVRRLINTDILLTDPLCASPVYFKDKSFSDLEKYCSQNDNTTVENYNSNKMVLNSTDRALRWWDKLDDIDGFVYISTECFAGYHFNNSPDATIKLYSPVHGHKCRVWNSPESGYSIVPSFASSEINPVLSRNNWIKFTYFLRTVNYSMVQVDAIDTDNFGLVWYQSTCPNEVYCVSDVPSVFRIYNVDLSAHYVFCPIVLSTGTIVRENCVHYHNVTIDIQEPYDKLQILLYVGTGTVSLIFGALCVYALIRKHPYLLKGSKRILFVKHKTVDALVLPPKIPLRNDLVNGSTLNCDEQKIFIVPSSHIVPNRFIRNISARSSKSSCPSYISALQPTEDQLAEWRIRHHFNTELSLASTSSDLSWISSNDVPYHSLDVDSHKTYESLK